MGTAGLPNPVVWAGSSVDGMRLHLAWWDRAEVCPEPPGQTASGLGSPSPGKVGFTGAVVRPRTRLGLWRLDPNTTGTHCTFSRA